MAGHGKKYRAARGQIDREQAYSPLEAIKMIKAWEGPKFDETVEAHVRLGLNVRHADQQLRGTLMLPHGTGKELRVAVFAEGEKAKEALNLESGSAEPNIVKVGKLTQAQLRSIAETKMPDLNAHDVEQAMKVIAGTARSMGVEVEA